MDPTLNSLFQSGKISKEQYEFYVLFEINPLGKACKERLMMETFMDEPDKDEFGADGFAFFDGRRSVIRDIYRAIEKIKTLIKEMELRNDGNNTE